MVNNSTDEHISSHFLTKTTTSDVGNPTMACDRYKNVAGLKLHRFASTRKDHILSQTMNILKYYLLHSHCCQTSKLFLESVCSTEVIKVIVFLGRNPLA